MKLIKIALSFAVIAMMAGSSALAQGPGGGHPGGGGGFHPAPGGGGQPGNGGGFHPQPQPQPGNGGGGFHPQPQPQPGNGGGGFHPQPQPNPGPYRPEPGRGDGDGGGFHPEPGRPIFNNPPPVFRFPVYPVYNNFPAGPCTIYANNAFNSYYTISNAYGQNIGSTYDYAQAMQIAENGVNSRQCSYVNNVTNNYQAPNECQIQLSSNAYGQTYVVITDEGAILDNTTNYQQALNDVQDDVQCYQ
jgi:hypothetical protein